MKKPNKKYVIVVVACLLLTVLMVSAQSNIYLDGTQTTFPGNVTVSGNFTAGQYNNLPYITNVASGLVATLTGWTVNPTSLNLATDDNYLTSTVAGSLIGSNTVYMKYDLTTVAKYRVNFKYLIGNNNTGGSPVNMFMESSVDDATWFRTNGYDGTFRDYPYNQNYTRYSLEAVFYGRYFRVGFGQSTATSTLYGSLYEIQVYLTP